jgi:hypothetical protein
MENLSKKVALLLIPFLTASGSAETENATAEPTGTDPLEAVTEQTSEFGDIATLMEKSSFTADEYNRLVLFANGTEVTWASYPCT